MNYTKSDGFNERPLIMEVSREPIAVSNPGNGGGGGIFGPPASGISRPPKSLAFAPPSGGPGGVLLFSPTGPAPPLTGSRRTTSISRRGGGGYRTAGIYRSRSGSVPPPGGSDNKQSSYRGGTNNNKSVRRSGTADQSGSSVCVEGTVLSVEERGVVMVQLDLLRLECANNGGGTNLTQQTYSDNDSPTESCAITTEERLIKTNPIWFLPDLQRLGAIHLLQGKEEGSFLVRQSSQKNTLAISVRLPADKGPHVQHYLVEIQPQGQYALEASDNLFPTLPALLAFYTKCCEELPVHLKLPNCVQDAKSRHELASIALLGQEFWGTTMASPLSTPVEDKTLAIHSPILRPVDLSFSSFGKGGLVGGRRGSAVTSPLTPLGGEFTPTRPAPPIPADRCNLNLNLDSGSSQISSFKSPNLVSGSSLPISSFKSPNEGGGLVRPPPLPPPRSSPPLNSQGGGDKQPPSSCIVPHRSSPQSPSNITVTTTLTFNLNSINGCGGSSSSQSTPSDEGIHLHVSSLEISPSANSSSSKEGLKLHFRAPPYTSSTSPPLPLTPLSEDGSCGGGRNKKGVKLRKKKREGESSHHYRESNVLLECHRSSLADKISDYEDLWTSASPAPNENGLFSPSGGIPEGSRVPIPKPRTDISKSLGDLSDVIRNGGGGNGEGSSSEEEEERRRQVSSPFYVEPMDALRGEERREKETSNVYDGGGGGRLGESTVNFYGETGRFGSGGEENRPRIRKSSSTRKFFSSNRHSDSNIEMMMTKNRRTRNVLARIDDDNRSSEDGGGHRGIFSSSNEKIIHNNNNYNRRVGGKPIAPPKIHPHNHQGGSNNTSRGHSSPNAPPNWVDASWEFFSYVGHSLMDGESALIPGDLTVHSLIKQKFPDLRWLNQNSPSSSLVDRKDPNLNGRSPLVENRYSIYDNVVRENTTRNEGGGSSNYGIPSSVSDSGTEFSEPWDSRKWDGILDSRDRIQESQEEIPESRDRSKSECDSLVQITGESESFDDDSLSMAPTISLSQRTNFDTNLRSKILSPQMLALRHRKDAESGASVRRYAHSLGCDTTSTFSQAIRHFLTCTLESNEKEAIVVVRNVRQFMSGMKNYLVTSGEGQFQEIVRKERSNLKSTEFLNLDAILEDVLVRLVLRPLWTHINQLYVENLTSDIQKLADNIEFAKRLHPRKLGIRPNLEPPKGAALEAIHLLLTKMQHVYAPREKLAYLLGMISHIYHAMYENGTCDSMTGDADDLVPMLMWILIHAQIVGAQVEADYIQGLLLPSSSSGEASYYLNAFQSAVHSLKNIDRNQTPNQSPGDSIHSLNQELLSDHGILRIIIPDEKNGSILTRTLPIRPGSTARELCRMMAHKLRVTNPQDFALYKLVDGQESLLADNECPHKVRKEFVRQGSHCMIAFKRIEAKIAWPLNT